MLRVKSTRNAFFIFCVTVLNPKGSKMMINIKKNWDKAALGAILLIAAVLSIWGIWNSGYGNEFYAASVKSMLTSFKNFFFVSLDSGGFVTVDKPPVSLWIQAIFAKVLGFYGWSVILPQGLAAVGSVFLVNKTVKKHFGIAPGLISSLALALSPIFIAVARTNNTDSILIFFMVLSTWAMMRAADKGSFKWLTLSVVFLGIAYNAKTLQAFLILPALFAGYFFTADTTWKKRFLHMVAATVILIAVSLSWSFIVDLTPANQRPYVDNSTTNSELELALNYNGLQRLTGQNRDNGGTATEKTSGNQTDGAFDGAFIAEGEGSSSRSTEGASQGSEAALNQQRDEGARINEGTYSGNSRPGADDGAMPFGNAGNRDGGGSMFSHGAQGLLRMFNSDLGGQDSWLLIFALFSIALLLILGRKKREPEKAKRMLLYRNAIIWGGSLLTAVIWFSVAQFFHEYYIATLAPFLAALVGIGVTQMWSLFKEERKLGYILPIAFGATITVQVIMLSYWPLFARILIPAVLILSGTPIVFLTAFKLMRKELPAKIPQILISLAVAGILMAPAVWTGYCLVGRVNAQLPTAGPSTSGFGSLISRDFAPQTGSIQREIDIPDVEENERNQSFDGEIREGTARNGSMPSAPSGGSIQGGGNSSVSNGMISYLLKNYNGEKWLVAVPDSKTAATVILATDKAAMSVGGFGGGTKILTVSRLEEMVKNHELRYFLLTGMGMGNDEVSTWIKQHGKVVSASEYRSGTSGGLSGTLYDLYT